MTSFFQHPERHLPPADARTVAALVSAASDLTLLIDGADLIEDISCTLDKGTASAIAAWRGRSVHDVVHAGSRSALKKMLAAARAGRTPVRFELNHLLGEGRDLPIQYSALGIGTESQIILMGRDLRPVAELQSRLLESRQTIQQNVKRQNQLEAHYRLLFETAADAILIVETDGGRIREANSRAVALLGAAGTGLNGRRLSALFDRAAQSDVQALLLRAARSATPAVLTLDAAGGRDRLVLSAELFRAGDLNLVMVRLTTQEEAAASSEPDLDALVRHAAEAVLLTDDDGKAVWVNESFLALAGLPLAAHATGHGLDHFFGWSGVEQDVLLQNVRRHGRVSAYAGTVRGANGQSTDVELSAVAMTEGATRGFGFVMRPRAADEPSSGRGNSDLTRTAENLVEMIGRVPMKDLVRDTTDVIEKMCIEAALNLTGNNRASAARVLGLSRQALYLKMNRFGIAGDE